jgi:hypothetical protein
MNDEKKCFPYWSPKSNRAVLAWHWAEYPVFFYDAIGKLNVTFLCKMQFFDFMQKFMKKFLSKHLKKNRFA